MAPVGLREQTVRDAKNIADARARHRWQIAPDYNVAIDCLDRHTELRDKPALFYEDDEGHSERYSFGQVAALSRRFANALDGFPFLVNGRAVGDSNSMRTVCHAPE